MQTALVSGESFSPLGRLDIFVNGGGTMLVRSKLSSRRSSKLGFLTHGTLTDQLAHRELSNGQFSADNQKRLNGHDMGVHIFEAKMTRDLRLVVSRILNSEEEIKLIHYR